MPIEFSCSCGKLLRVKDGTSGRVFACPSCGQRLEVPSPDAIDLGINLSSPIDDAASKSADDSNISPSVFSATPPLIQPPSSPPPIRPKDQSLATKRAFRMTTFRQIILTTMGVIFFLMGIGSFFGNNSTRYRSYREGERFQTDNAYGAAANALEKIEQKPEYSHPEGWIVASLICSLILAVDELRWTIENKDSPV